MKMPCFYLKEMKQMDRGRKDTKKLLVYTRASIPQDCEAQSSAKYCIFPILALDAAGKAAVLNPLAVRLILMRSVIHLVFSVKELLLRF